MSINMLHYYKEEKEKIVKLHNKLRSKVASGKEHRGVNGTQPTATNMRKLVWSDELAQVAQRYYLSHISSKI